MVFKSLQIGNIFTSKEVENAMRARNIKRIAFAIFSGEMDKYSGYVTGIQEKLLEALKLAHAHSVYEQVFLCMRVLLLRVTPKRLATFWPAILTEMVCFFLLPPPPSFLSTFLPSSPSLLPSSSPLFPSFLLLLPPLFPPFLLLLLPFPFPFPQ